MQYFECPGCRASLYSAASHSWIVDACPVCSTSLEGTTKKFPSAVGARTLRRELPPTPGAIARARHALDGLYVELGEQLHRTAELLVRELDSNSVKHSRQQQRPALEREQRRHRAVRVRHAHLRARRGQRRR